MTLHLLIDLQNPLVQHLRDVDGQVKNLGPALVADVQQVFEALRGHERALLAPTLQECVSGNLLKHKLRNNSEMTASLGRLFQAEESVPHRCSHPDSRNPARLNRCISRVYLSGHLLEDTPYALSRSVVIIAGVLREELDDSVHE